MPELPLPNLPPRSRDSHKGDFGHALLIGGSRGMAGAISLAGMAALRSGAGLVTIATPGVCLETVAGFEPCYMTVPLSCDTEGRIDTTSRADILARCQSATALACGPGIGRSDALVEVVASIYSQFPRAAVFDADALFALAQSPEQLRAPGGPRILTPHPGEFSRLVDQHGLDRDQQKELARGRAAAWGSVIVLKGHETLVTDGHQHYINTTGNPGMATGGTGDVLTGIIVALLCEGLEAFPAAQLGVYVHGAAGDLAAAELGETSLTARDLIAHLPAAFRAIASS